MNRKRWFTCMTIFCLGGMMVAQQASPARSRKLDSHHLPEMNGKDLNVELVEVSYGPGDASPVHSHSCPVIVYVLEGAVRTQVKGQPAMTVKAGGTFYEAPRGTHLVSANASKTQPAKFLAIFVCDGEGSI